MRVIIICGGTPPSRRLIEEVCGNSYIICADSGANILYDYGIIPNYLIGDFDSIRPEVLEFYRSRFVTIDQYPTEKDDTDSELALKKALKIGATEIVLLGCIGSRIDHIFGNLGLLRICVEHNIKGTIKDDFNTIFLTDRSILLKGEKGQLFSLQCFSSIVKKLNIFGAKYPLKNYDLQSGDPTTISNVFTGDDVHIEFEEGLLLIFYSKD